MNNAFITVLNMSVMASCVAAVVILARLLLKKVPKIFSYALWAVVLFRMICPFSFESVISILPINSEVIPQDIAMQTNPRIDSGIVFVDNAVNNIIRQPSVQPESASESVGLLQIVINISSYIWLIGIVVLFIYVIVSYIKIKRRIFAATLVRNKNIFETDRIKSPFVIGFIKPKIYIPAGLDEIETDYIIKHEETHIKRRDHLIKLLAYIGLTIHWFNPLMWLSYFLMSKDMELSCDESVMRKSGEDIRANYSNSLLSLSVKQSGLPNPLAFGESNVKSRIKNVLNFKRHSRLIIIIAVVVAAVVILGGVLNKIKQDNNDASVEFIFYGYGETALVPDFLTEEQQNIYKQAVSFYHLELMPDVLDMERFFPLKDGQEYIAPNEGSWTPDIALDDDKMYVKSIGRYRKWEDFEKLTMSVFTPEAFSKLNVNGQFMEMNGDLYLSGATGMPRWGYSPALDTFNLISSSDNEIKFTVTQYYIDGYDEVFENLTTQEIILTKTSKGWCFSKFDTTWSSINIQNNYGEVWDSERFLERFTNFESEASLFIEFNHTLPLNKETVESSIDELSTAHLKFDSLYITYMAYKLENALGVEFDADGDWYLIPEETVTNLLLQINGNLQESDIIYEERFIYNSEYLKATTAFGGKIFTTKILSDTIKYDTKTNIVKFDLQVYIAESDMRTEDELVVLKYEFSPFVYKDAIQLYRFISVEKG